MNCMGSRSYVRLTAGTERKAEVAKRHKLGYFDRDNYPEQSAVDLTNPNSESYIALLNSARQNMEKSKAQN